MSNTKKHHFWLRSANLVNSYKILSTSVVYIASRSFIPRSSLSDVQSTLGSSSNPTDHHDLRGDTLLLPPPTPLNPTPNELIATTRGSSGATRGWLSDLPLDSDGNFVDAEVKILIMMGMLKHIVFGRLHREVKQMR